VSNKTGLDHRKAIDEGVKKGVKALAFSRFVGRRPGQRGGEQVLEYNVDTIRQHLKRRDGRGGSKIIVERGGIEGEKMKMWKCIV